MLVARLVGHLWSTRKYESLNGYKLMLLELESGSRAGEQLVAVDTISAGIGDRVLVSCGSAAWRFLEAERDDVCVPVDAVIIGIIDEDCKIPTAGKEF